MGVVGPGMTSITDSKVGLASCECCAPNNVVRMVEPAGRNHRYGYEVWGVLKTLTAPDGTVTTLGSDADQQAEL